MSLGQFLDDLVDLAAGVTVTFTPVATVDKNNQAASYGAAVAYTTYVAGPVKFMHRESAQEKVSSQTLYVFTPNAIATTDVVTMPSGYQGTTSPKIDQVDRKSDELGFCYTVVYLG